MATKLSRGCSIRLRDGLYGVFVESCIISFSLLSGLAVAVGMLISLKIIQAPPGDKQNDVVNKSSAILSTSTTTRAIDPGGSTSDPLHITELVCHYTSLGIAALFLLEILLKMLVIRTAFFLQFWQIFDALVVVGAFSVEVVFTLLGKEVVWDEAATFVVLLRLWRVLTVCNINAKKTKECLDQEIHDLKSAKTKYEGKCCSQQDRLDRQQLRIVELERRIVQTTKHLDEITQLQTPHKDETQLSSNTQERICYGGLVANGFLNASVVNSASNPTQSETEDMIGQKTPDDTVNAGSEDAGSCSKTGSDGVEVADVGVSQARSRRCSNGADAEDDVDSAAGHHNVVVQIEEPSPQHVVAVTDDTTKLIEEVPSPVSYENEVFDKEDEVVVRDLAVLAKHVDGTKTYRSAEGIPMTTL